MGVHNDHPPVVMVAGALKVSSSQLSKALDARG
jgi:hypothetical protein